jgi:hypothetical protein
MNDANPPPWDGQDPARGAQRGAPLSITTSRPQIDGSRAGQYQADQNFAQPRSSGPYRTTSDPFPPPSPAQRGVATRASSGDVPKSAGYTDSSLRFLKGGKGDKGDKSPSSSRSDKGDNARRRHSSNNYTECGRHGDDWLFGGFSVSDSVKKLWERDKKS